MTNERVVEVPWALAQLPQSGLILDVGSCDATYLAPIPQPERVLHCLDPRDCPSHIPPGTPFFVESIIGNSLPRGEYDAVLLVSVLEHIGLPCYGQEPFKLGDYLTLAEIRALLKPSGSAIVTVPVGKSKITTWYRQYSARDIYSVFATWQVDVTYWGFNGRRYVLIAEEEVDSYDYRDRSDDDAGAGAVAGIVARPRPSDARGNR